MFADLVIRADASQKFGQGHARRCMNLVNAFQESGVRRVVWAGTEETKSILPELAEKYQFITVPDGAPQETQISVLASQMQKKPDLSPFVVIDGYHLDYKTVNAFAEEGFHGVTAFIDEKIDRQLGAPDFVFDFLPHQRSDYLKFASQMTIIESGPLYMMVSPKFNDLAKRRQEFMSSANKHDRKKVILMNGGMNIGNMLEDILGHLSEESGLWANCDFHCYMMSKASSAATVELAIKEAQTKNISAELHFDHPDVPSEMVDTSLYIGAAGLTPYELGAVGGCPSVVMGAGHNQDSIADRVSQSQAGINAGSFLSLNLDGTYKKRGLNWAVIRDGAQQYLNNENMWKDAMAKSRKFCDGNGATRVARTMLNHCTL